MTAPRELWFLAAGRVAVGPAKTRGELGEGQVRARALASGISQGTELLLYRGEGPTPFDPSLDPPGAPTFPRRYGYAWVGRVEESRCDVPVGTVVFALRPHGDEHVIDAAEVRVLPPLIPPERATLAANLETAITVTWDAGVSLGDEVVVIGGGTVGLLSAWLAKQSGARRVKLIEPAPRRRQAGLALGIDCVAAPEDDEPTGAADVVVEASGSPELLDRAIAYAAPEGTVVVASFYGERRALVDLGSAFHRGRLILRASQVSRLSPAKAARWTKARRFELALDLLRDARLDGLIDRPVSFAAAPSVYARLHEAPGAALHTVFTYGT